VTVDEIIDRTIKGKQDEFTNRPAKLIREKRRYELAKAAMQGLLTNPSLSIEVGKDVENLVGASVKLADVMLMVLEEKE
jgi:hypothetical protein